MRRTGYLPTLDGWRAAAILIVLLSHSPTIHAGPFDTDGFHYAGDLGVDIFFALSGLLITSRLLDEEEITGKLHLKGFYIRRVCRIQPAALVYLGTASLLMAAHMLPTARTLVLAAVLNVQNILSSSVSLRTMLHVPLQGSSGWSTGHFWSLAVEEQFYLCLPIALSTVRRYRKRLLLTVTLLDLAWYLWMVHRHHGNLGPLGFRPDLCFHFLLLASWVALLLRSGRVRVRLTAMFHWWWTVPVLIASLVPYSPLQRLTFLLPTALVLSSLLHPGSLLSRIFETAPVRYVGRISYSLYLWQELFLNGYYAPNLHTFGNMQRMWMMWPATFLCAAASYQWIEKPFVRLGHRLAKPAVPGRPEAIPAHRGRVSA